MTARKKVKYPAEWYKECLDKYQELRGIELHGPENAPIQQALKTMFMSNRKPEDIIGCMEWLAEGSEEWMKNWTINTVKMKMPFYKAKKIEKKPELVEDDRGILQYI